VRDDDASWRGASSARVETRFLARAEGFRSQDTDRVGEVITCEGVQKVMADEYALTMPYRSPVQSVGRMVRGVVKLVKAVLRAFGIGKVAKEGTA